MAFRTLPLTLLILAATACAGTRPARMPEEFRRDSRIKIAFGSCIKNPQTSIWSSILEKDADIFMLLGDNIYQGKEDFGNAEEIRKKYDRLLLAPSMPELLAQTYPVALWDDHDFGPNNSDSRYDGRSVSLAEFHRAWPNNPPPPPGLEDTVSSELRLGLVEILAVDGRSRRRNYLQDDSPQMFGPEQLAWIEDRLANTRSPFVVLATGNQWLATSHVEEPKIYETLAQYPNELKRVLRAVAQSPAHVILVSGDRHLAEVLRMPLENGRVVFDLASSPLSAVLAKGEHAGTDDNRAAIVIGRTNFGMLTLDGRSNSALFELFDTYGDLILRWPLSR